MGRPIKHLLDEAKLIELAEQACTYEEIAAILDVSILTIRRRYDKAIKKGKLKFRGSLRRLQYRSARGFWVTRTVTDEVTGRKTEVSTNKYIEPNSGMLVWLGKQYLGQSEFGAGDETDEHPNFEDLKEGAEVE